MTRTALSTLPASPALLRLTRLGAAGAAETAAVSDAVAGASISRARRELISEGKPIGTPLLIASGWAARVRLLPDGRRQFLSFFLPGDLLGMCRQPQPLAVSTVVALTDVALCAAPSAAGLPGLAEAYAVSQAMEEGHLLGQIARLGRMNAQERIADLLLELHERLTLVGLADRTSFDLPLTQELLGDALGLTSVHINRTLQMMRRDGDLEWKGRRVTLYDPLALARRIGRVPVRVTSQSLPDATGR